MDFLYIDNLAFPVQRATISELRNGEGDYRWCIEIHCGVTKNPNDEHWLAGTEPYLYAQLLPLRVSSPEELVGRTYYFPQSPDDEPPTWESGQWPFFCAYLHEHEYLYPVKISFDEHRDNRYRILFEGKYPCGDESHEIKVQTWLVWEQG